MPQHAARSLYAANNTINMSGSKRERERRKNTHTHLIPQVDTHKSKCNQSLHLFLVSLSGSVGLVVVGETVY